jgi:hypothetical protein
MAPHISNGACRPVSSLSLLFNRHRRGQSQMQSLPVCIVFASSQEARRRGRQLRGSLHTAPPLFSLAHLIALAHGEIQGTTKQLQKEKIAFLRPFLLRSLRSETAAVLQRPPSKLSAFTHLFLLFLTSFCLLIFLFVALLDRCCCCCCFYSCSLIHGRIQKVVSFSVPKPGASKTDRQTRSEFTDMSTLREGERGRNEGRRINKKMGEENTRVVNTTIRCGVAAHSSKKKKRV